MNRKMEDIGTDKEKDDDKMVTVVGVRFKSAGKIYYFDPEDMKLELGDCVIVETARGLEYGEIASSVTEVDKLSLIHI